LTASEDDDFSIQRSVSLERNTRRRRLPSHRERLSESVSTLNPSECFPEKAPTWMFDDFKGEDAVEPIAVSPSWCEESALEHTLQGNQLKVSSFFALNLILISLVPERARVGREKTSQRKENTFIS
jgi:hypothetical protein